MIYLRTRLECPSPAATPWQADTIWGHLAWGLRYSGGEAALREFLDRYRAGSPPLILSDGLPADDGEALFPRPLLPATLPAASSIAERAVQLERARSLRRTGYVSRAEFERVRAGAMPSETPRGLQPLTLTRNAIDRSTLGAGGESGALYTLRAWWATTIIIYALVEEDFADAARLLLWDLARTGYGKRRSTGLGAVRSVDVEEFEGWAAPAGANAAILLSTFMPAPTDPADGWWEAFVKYGRLGEGYASGPNPFKRPLVMFRPGAVLFDSEPRPYYGRLVEGVSGAHPEVVNCGLGLAVPARVARGRD